MKEKLAALYENLKVETDLKKNVPARNFKKVAPTRFLGFTAEIKTQLITYIKTSLQGELSIFGWTIYLCMRDSVLIVRNSNLIFH